MKTPIERMIDEACGYTPSKRTATEAEKDIARALAYKAIDHIDEMYPAMWEGVPKTARISVRNTVYNNTLQLILQLPKSEWSQMPNDPSSATRRANQTQPEKMQP